MSGFYPPQYFNFYGSQMLDPYDYYEQQQARNQGNQLQRQLQPSQLGNCSQSQSGRIGGNDEQDKAPPKPNKKSESFKADEKKYYNFYGSQMLDPYQQQQVRNQGNQPQRQLQPSQLGNCSQSQSGRIGGNDEQDEQDKAPPKPNKKSESFKDDEEKYMINLWVAYHERLESKDSRKYWSKLVDELNTKYNNNRALEKVKRRIKYLIEKYKERKDWNKKQSGGNLWKSPHYEEIDSVLGVRDVVELERIGEAGCSSSSTSSSAESTPTTASDSPKGTLSTEETQKDRKNRKRSKSAATKRVEEDEREEKFLKAMTEQGDKMAQVIQNMQESQAKVMSGFMDAMTAIMKNMNK